MRPRLAIIVSHPIQYYAPLFREMNERNIIQVKVFYTLGEYGFGNLFDKGFNKSFEWDIPLLEGYDYEFLTNTSETPGVHSFKGIVNPDAVIEINRFNPDAVLVFGWSFVSHLKIMRHFKGRLPVFFRGDSTFIDEQAKVKKLLRTLFLKWVYKHVDLAFTVGKYNREYYLQAGMKEKQFVLAPHAIDNSRFMLNSESFEAGAHRLRKEMNIDQHALVLLFAGKFEMKKDPLLLLTAFNMLEISSDAHLVFVGNGPLEEQMKLLAEGYPSIHFLDFQNQQMMPVIYRLADVFILPSRGPNETWGLAINEAMASGCAVLVSDKCGSAPDLVEEGRNGFVFKAGDAEDLKCKIEMMINEKEQLPSRRKASIEKVKQFSFEKICVAVENVMTRLHPGHPKS